MPVSVDDRRLTSRMLAKWTVITEGQRMPRRAEITPEAFGDDWCYCSLIALDPVLWRSRLAHVGEVMRDKNWAPDMPQVLKDYTDGSLLRLAAAKIPAMIAKRGPITFGGTGAHNAKPMLYRAILLPLSEDNRRVDHALGAINYREIRESEDDFMDEPTGLAAEDSIVLAKADPVRSYFAFTGRRVYFASPGAKKPLQGNSR